MPQWYRDDVSMDNILIFLQIQRKNVIIFYAKVRDKRADLFIFHLPIPVFKVIIIVHINLIVKWISIKSKGNYFCSKYFIKIVLSEKLKLNSKTCVAYIFVFVEKVELAGQTFKFQVWFIEKLEKFIKDQRVEKGVIRVVLQIIKKVLHCSEETWLD